MATGFTASSSEEPSFNPVYPYNALLTPVNKGALSVTSAPKTSSQPPIGSFNPVYPFNENDKSLADGKLVVTGEASDFLAVSQGLQLTGNTLKLTPAIVNYIQTTIPLHIQDMSLGLTLAPVFSIENKALQLQVQDPLAISSKGLGLRLGSGLSVVSDALEVKAMPPFTLSPEGLSLNLGDGLTTNSGGAVTVSVGEGFSFSQRALELNLDSNLSVSGNQLHLSHYSYGWTGVGVSQTVLSAQKNSYTVYPVLVLERMGQLVHGLFSAACFGTLNAGDSLTISFYFTTAGTLASSSSYSGPWGGRGNNNTVTSGNQLALLLPTSEYQDSISSAQHFTVTVASENGSVSGAVAFSVQTEVPDDATVGLQFILTVDKTVEDPRWDAIGFTYLSK